MRYLANTTIICIEYDELVPEFMKDDNYQYHKKNFKLIAHGRKGVGSGVLIEMDSLPPRIREQVMAKYGNDLHKYIAIKPIAKMVTHDLAAADFYSTHIKNGGGTLSIEHQQQYTRQAEWLNMIDMMLSDRRQLKEHLNISIEDFWQYVIDLHQVDKPINPKLPTAYDPLRKLLVKYKTEGYAGLVSKRFGNQKARKVTGDIERLLVSLYCDERKPNYADVCRMYTAFLLGNKIAVDIETGTAFIPRDFYQNGTPKGIQVGSVKNYLKKPINMVLIGKYRQGKLEHSSMNLPSNQRMGPQYAFSKLTMDDTSSPFKMYDNTRPATYKVFDVCSGALVSMAIHKKVKADGALVRSALANMFTVIIQNKWKHPAEIEVEHAINTTLTGNKDRKGAAGEKDRAARGVIEDVLTQGAVFQFVTFCAAENPQEKRAEGFINRFKYDFQKWREGFQRRIFSRRESMRANKDSDSFKMRFSYEDIVAMEYEDMALWNNSAHPDKERFPNMTRWQVLEQCQHPKLKMPDLPAIMPYVGFKSETSVNRYRVQVRGNSYNMPSVDVFASLTNKRVDAYWLPDTNGDVGEVYLYQDKKFVGVGSLQARFQEAKFEQTEDDMAILGQQRRYKQDLLDRVEQMAGNVVRLGMTTSTDDDEVEEQGKYADKPVLVEEVVVNTPDISLDNVGFMTKKGKKQGGYKQNEGTKAVQLPVGESVESRAAWAL